jgi:hypothetical protein
MSYMQATETKANLVEQIERIAADGLDALHSREALVLKMRQIYSLAVLANVKPGDDEDDDE